ncbi:exosome complex component RRP45A-like [Amaranthus tricolor]|uniref:exosome complex component RRP45A-like n=1 Tax=Amaranthus tricolor TaxID=29722 RepID=UPI00258B5A2D|nr:exosome complex component RRP45A-like [Amaranthus tricolor]XP_057536430.1 exosome complex component RRP45A-like [Amaranthus tricolor]XP_057536431.1 exosome complex component RRP45A-like [Amaranthus tricolor]XP_057536432.1 exosome complex component RRP45A-like [Amaranthus tricolor]XP_057536433.1 exosome complex component RRP45A-like [Amaranthus tricolor]XP_057536434.1 exosome complex component RRP45A-like [Amaranthus tricolor]
MERLANSWRMSLNEKNFIETALLLDVRADGRSPLDYRELKIEFGRENGSSVVELGQTRVMSCVTAQLVQPFRDRPNEGSLTIYIEFSSMADPSFEPGRPGESAVELGRIIDRGLRESRAVDTESLCVCAGKLAWSVRIDIQILDNGGNLVDAANIAALAALMTFRRSECTIGEDGQEVVVHPPQVREPCALIIHHLPIAVTFAFMTQDNILVIDPSYYEEAIMKGRMTVTLNANEDVCAIQKAGEVGIGASVIIQCLRIAAVKAVEITGKLETAVKSYNADRENQRTKLLSSMELLHINPSNSYTRDDKFHFICENNDLEAKKPSCKGKVDAYKTEARVKGGPLCWDPFSKGVDSRHLRASLFSHGKLMVAKANEALVEGHQLDSKLELKSSEIVERNSSLGSSANAIDVEIKSNGIKTLKDAVKPKIKRKKPLFSNTL